MSIRGSRSLKEMQMPRAGTCGDKVYVWMIKGDVGLLVNTFSAICILETQRQIEAANYQEDNVVRTNRDGSQVIMQ